MVIPSTVCIGEVSESTVSKDEVIQLIKEGSKLSNDEAVKLEKANPQDLSTRTKLLGYYVSQERKQGSQSKGLQCHLEWIIQNHPGSIVAGFQICHITPIQHKRLYKRVKKLWLKQVKTHNKSAVVLGNAGYFFFFIGWKMQVDIDKKRKTASKIARKHTFIFNPDMVRAENLFKRAQVLEPQNPKWPRSLGNIYTNWLKVVPDDLNDKKKEIAGKALEQLEISKKNTADEKKLFHLLISLAKVAIEANEFEKAKIYAEKLLNQAPQYKENMYYGRAVHYGNLVLGRLALKSGDMDRASTHLLKAGQTPGGPTLNYYGPDTTLAKELLKAGEEKTVSEYFQLCTQFWKRGTDRLKSWISIINKGGIPDFNMYLDNINTAIFTRGLDEKNQPVDNIEKISMNEGKINIYTYWNSISNVEHTYTCKIFDGSGNNVFNHQFKFTPKRGYYETRTLYKFNKYKDKYGDWKFKIYLDKEKKIEKNLVILQSEDAFKFEILTPWYRAWWAFLSYALVIFILTYFVVRWRRSILAKMVNIFTKKIKLIAVILMIVTLAVGIGFVFNMRAYRADMMKNATMQAKLVSGNCATPLELHAVEKVENELEKLLIEIPDIICAIVYSEDENIFASINRNNSAYLPELSVNTHAGEFKEDFLHIFQPIISRSGPGNRKIGTIHLTYSTDRLKSMIRDSLVRIFLFIIGFIFLMMYFIGRWRSSILEQEKQRLEQTVKDRTKELEQQSEKLKEMDKVKSRFFANISHEFRTPITLIMGPLEQMLSNNRDKEQVKKINLMLRNSRRLLGLINQLLELSKFDSGKIKLNVSQSNIVPFLKGIGASFEPVAAKNELDLSFHTEEENIMLYFDSKKLEEAVFNLLANAVKFTPPGGKVTIKIIRNGTGDKNFPSGSVEISVSDTGPGIPRDRLSHIFDRFYQSENTYENNHNGSGIGLAIAKEVVELHHGKINVHSLEGKGTEFIIRIPLGKEHLKPDEIAEPGVPVDIKGVPADAKGAPEVIDLSEDDGGETGPVKNEKDIDPFEQAKDIILVVEDSTDVRDYIRGSLEPIYSVVEARDGREGIQKAQEIIPDLIISDIMMPGVDGYELCRVLKNDKNTSHVPIILLTAKASEQSVIQGLETGADDYITKPFNTNILCARIKNLIDLRRQMQLNLNREMTLQPVKTTVSKLDKEFIRELQEVIEKNLSEPEFNVEELKKKLCIGGTSLYRKIHALSGQSPTDFIRSYRLKRAAQLLKSGFGSVTEVAFEVGFTSRSYFAKCFKEKFHQVPSNFKEIG
jgi:signal transduction histidine kinase/DNA-binding response OmpR family regulator